MIRARNALPALVLLFAGTAAVSAQSPSPGPELAAPEVMRIHNDGGAREGHTPTAFAGMGTGLFAGLFELEITPES